MKKYKIDGTEKASADTMPKCNICKDGEIFKDSPYKVSKTTPYITEHICLECETKYKETRLTPVLETDFIILGEIRESKITEFNYENKDLNNKTAPYITLKIGQEYGEAIKMNPKVIELRNEYDKTNECKEHLWIESKPFKTSEGNFTIKNCAICKEGSMNYKGKEIKGTLMELINFLIKQSQTFNDKAKYNIDLFGDMMKDLGKEITTSINVVKELPIIENKENPLNLFTNNKDLNLF